MPPNATRRDVSREFALDLNAASFRLAGLTDDMRQAARQGLLHHSDVLAELEIAQTALQLAAERLVADAAPGDFAELTRVTRDAVSPAPTGEPRCEKKAPGRYTADEARSILAAASASRAIAHNVEPSKGEEQARYALRGARGNARRLYYIVEHCLRYPEGPCGLLFSTLLRRLRPRGNTVREFQSNWAGCKRLQQLGLIRIHGRPSSAVISLTDRALAFTLESPAPCVLPDPRKLPALNHLLRTAAVRCS